MGLVVGRVMSCEADYMELFFAFSGNFRFRLPLASRGMSVMALTTWNYIN